MINILKHPDDIKVYCEEKDETDAFVEIKVSNRRMFVNITAQNSRPRFICMRWNHIITAPTRIMGDKWERSYGNMEWHSLNGEIFMPWYFIANCGNKTVGCGVMTGCNSFVSFQCDQRGCTAWFDVRCGGTGVELNGRTLLAGVIICERYEDISPFKAAQNFCRLMCKNPRLPKIPVYGSNNWYYAYGNSSRKDILRDADIISELAGENENKPFMVIDDGWSVNRCKGPWKPNEKFGDMEEICCEIKKRGVRPGIWFRPLFDLEAQNKHPEWRIKKPSGACMDENYINTEDGFLGYLDPTVTEVKEHLRKIIRRIKAWGYELIKHDFSTFDIFGNFGINLNGMVTPDYGWTFHDKTKTSAEVILDFYRLLREEAGEMIIIGCNTISHLSAGIFELYRAGDDTSGKEWSRTRAYGINALAFRMCQNNAFYKVDADCVGIIKNMIDWKLNRQWLDLLAKSGTPLFVSIQPDSLTKEIKKDLIDALRINAIQQNSAEPIDWLYNNQPAIWMIDGKIKEYDFVMDSYPVLLGRTVQPY